jgi:probable phosphoglycerate mutase
VSTGVSDPTSEPAVNTVYFVRHGQNPANVTREFSYKLVDYPLTDLGIRQAQQTAAYFAGRPVDAVYSSPLKRARQTAEIIGAATGHGIKIVEEFREVNCGSLEGQPPTDALWALHDQIMRRWRDGEHDVGFPDGEDYHALVARARAGLEQITAGQHGQHIVVVTHGGIVGATIKDVCRDLDLDLVWRVPNANCAVTEIEVQASGDETWGTLKRWAACDHLTEG